MALALGINVSFCLNLSLLFRMYKHFFLLLNGHIYNKNTAIYI